MNIADSFKVSASNSLTQLKGSVITDGLDKLNSFGSSLNRRSWAATQNAMSDTYNFSNSVLSAVYENKGGILNTNS